MKFLPPNTRQDTQLVSRKEVVVMLYELIEKVLDQRYQRKVESPEPPKVPDA